INLEMPKELDYYVHRVGRTARAGGSGIAISFYTDDDIGLIELLEKNNIVFEYYDIKNNDWKEVKRYDYRQKRQSFVTDVDKEAWRQVDRKSTRLNSSHVSI